MRELKFSVIKAKFVVSKVPNSRVHNLRAVVELNGDIIHLFRTLSKEEDLKYPEHVLVMDDAIQVCTINYSLHDNN